MYEHHKIGRNMAWEVMLDCGINRLPVNLGDVADHYGIKIILFSDTELIQIFQSGVLLGDGFIANHGGEKQIFINDTIYNRNRCRFTLAHELGHAVLNHSFGEIRYRNSEIDSQTDMQELEANVFARDLLMPATVLLEDEKYSTKTKKGASLA